MKVSQLMSSNVISVTPEDTAANAARLIARNNIGSLPVCMEDGKLKGIVTDRDIVIRCIAPESDPETTKVREIMTRGVISVASDADIREAAQIMSGEQIRRLPVTSEGKIVGMISLGDMAKTQSFDMEASKALSEISMPPRKYGKDS
ncbi:MAG: CBS domain-containing protein [Clostridiales bacterium]|nr:CBS domain-containing protein [Clostridiales bacterium]